MTSPSVTGGAPEGDGEPRKMARPTDECGTTAGLPAESWASVPTTVMGAPTGSTDCTHHVHGQVSTAGGHVATQCRAW